MVEPRAQELLNAVTFLHGYVTAIRERLERVVVDGQSTDDGEVRKIGKELLDMLDKEAQWVACCIAGVLPG